MRSTHLTLAAVAALAAASRLGRRGSAASDPDWLQKARARYENPMITEALTAAHREVSPEPEWLQKARARYENPMITEALTAAHRDTSPAPSRPQRTRPQPTLPAPSRPRRTRPQSTLPAPSRPQRTPSDTVERLLSHYRASVGGVSDAIARKRLAMLPESERKDLLKSLGG
jgi:hypothetical protein